jgi:purine-nucleoside phosphorylase
MNAIELKVKTAYEALRVRVPDCRPDIGVVLGSGLGGFADSLTKTAEVAFSEIEGFPAPTAPGHEGKLIFGRTDGARNGIVVMRGRVHCYEGYSAADTVLPVRVMRLLGVKILVLTNAAGGINPRLEKGSLMAITDHICAVPNPLIGGNCALFGTRFPDMSRVYDADLLAAMRRAARQEGVPLAEGVYYQCTGPAFETPAEIRMMRTLGADAVGMSTAAEAIAARHAGMRVAGISAISNKAAGLAESTLSHNVVEEAAALYGDTFTRLLTRFIGQVSVAEAAPV